MARATVRIAILGDPHFCVAADGEGSPPSRIVVSKLGTGTANPWDHLFKLVRELDLRSDVVLSPGDITTHANSDALVRSWGELLKLGEAMSADIVACATGNHDVATRILKPGTSLIRDLDHPVHPIEALQNLAPQYPIFVRSKGDDQTLHCQRRTHYFGTDFVIHEDDAFRLIVLNSCGRHTQESASYERGFFAPFALRELRRQLKDADPEKINVAICHHPPHIHDFGLGAYDVIKGGEELLDAFNMHGDWIVIHGHKHSGRIEYSKGTSSTAPVFAAGSLGATLDPEYRNQFYILEITRDDQMPPRGTVRAWDWEGPKGWVESFDQSQGIASGSGFGDRRDHREQANEIAKLLNGGTMKWRDLVERAPWISNLPTPHLGKVLETLRTVYRIGQTQHPDTKEIDEVGHG